MQSQWAGRRGWHAYQILFILSVFQSPSQPSPVPLIYFSITTTTCRYIHTCTCTWSSVSIPQSCYPCLYMHETSVLELCVPVYTRTVCIYDVYTCSVRYMDVYAYALVLVLFLQLFSAIYLRISIFSKQLTCMKCK